MPEPGLNTLPLQAGPWQMSFDCRTGFLRRLMVGDREVIRAIYGAVRDAHWETIHPVLMNFRKSQGQSNFDVSFEALCKRKEIHFDWNGNITANEEGELSFQFQGVARTDFQSNRIGLCVLHPLAECVGRECLLTRPDGTTAKSRFPEWIAPHQPFKQIRKMRYDIAQQSSVEIEFEGEVFETEDQRNWTDGSFKTYGTPLDLPFPVLIRAGHSVHQKITVRYCSPTRYFTSPSQSALEAPAAISRTGIQRPKPDIGIGLEKKLLPGELSFLKRLGLGHLRFEVRFQNTSWRSQLEVAADVSTSLKVPLHLALFFSKAVDLESNELLSVLRLLNSNVSLFIVYSESEWVTPVDLLLTVRAKFRSFPNANFSSGTKANFAELNRNRDSVADVVPCYSINPQVHVEDDLSVMENLQAQAATAETAASFSNFGVAVSPVTLKLRMNVHRVPRDAEGNPTETVSDPRQTTGFCAAWTLGSIAALASTNNVGSITYYEVEGDKGIMKRNLQDESSPQLYPVFHLFQNLARVNDFEILASSDSLAVQGLSCRVDGKESHLLLANLKSVPQEISMKSERKFQSVTLLDGGHRKLSFKESDGEHSISVPAYGLVKVDFVI